MEIDEIKSLLPHRYPFLLLDRVTSIKEEGAEGIKCVSHNEPFFLGHFPEYPVMPGVLILEALAQLGGVLLLSANKGELKGIPLLLGVDRARFRKEVRPGDQLRLRVQRLKSRAGVVRFSGQAFVLDELACEAEFLVGRP
jgi:3-hydroxyacyl-[acyl-carrier-protein] dehydratase